MHDAHVAQDPLLLLSAAQSRDLLPDFQTLPRAKLGERALKEFKRTASRVEAVAKCLCRGPSGGARGDLLSEGETVEARSWIISDISASKISSRLGLMHRCSTLSFRMAGWTS